MPYVIVGILIVMLALWAIQRGLLASVERQLQPLVDGLREMRALAVQEPSFRTPSPEHPKLLKFGASYVASMARLEALGCTSLGLVEEMKQDGASAGITQWFVDQSRQICGWFGVIDSPQGPVCPMLLFTELDTSAFVFTNFGGSAVRLAGPPTIERAYLESNTPLEEVFATHRAAIAARGAVRPRQVDSLATAHSLVRRLKDHANAWRSRQPESELLVADLQNMLGKRYKEFGPAMISIMSRSPS